MLNRIVVLGLFVLAVGAAPAPAHQVLVSDPTSVPAGAAQLEMWHSPEESWIAPAGLYAPSRARGGRRRGRVETDVSVTRAGPFEVRETWITVGLTFMSTLLYGSDTAATR